MKRSQPEPSSSAPPKKQAMTKILETVSIGPVSTEEEMNTKVLVFQNKKLAERLEILKLDEERLRERLEDVKKKRNSDFEILSIINRAWTQLDEDVSILQQSYVDGVVEGEFGDQSDTALSYLEYLSQVEPAQIKQEVGKRVANSKQCIQKLLSYMEKARCFPPRPIRIVASKSMQTVTDEEASTEQMDTDEAKENVAGEDKEPSEETSKEIPECDSKPGHVSGEPMAVERDAELEEVKAENRRLRELMTSLQQKQETTSLEFSEIRDKYALKQREISELNTQLQDSEYDLQKANHRVENLVKRLHELEEMKKKIREGEIPSKKEISSEGQDDDEEENNSEFMEVKELANNRLDELQKLREECIAVQQEVEKLKLEAIQIPESIVVQSSPYKCLQSQFSVLFNEVTTSRQQLDDSRRSLSATKTQHMLQLEQIESEITTTHKKYKSEVNELHDALLHCKREYDLLRIEYEQVTKSNEQSAPLIKEVSYMNNSLQNYNKQLKGEIVRYKRKLFEAQAQTKKLEEELTRLRESKKNENQEKKEEEDQKPKEEMEVQEQKQQQQQQEPKTTPKEAGEEGELEEGEEEEEPSTSNSDTERVKQLQASLKKSQESQKEMKLLLDVYKGAAKDLRDKVELLASEKNLKKEIEELQKRVQELEQELEKYKGAMADEEAIRRLKMAEETIVQLQKNLAATKQEEDALLAEMEFTGQEYVEMQEQNMRLLQQLREKDDANLKLMSERIKTNQIQKQIREEKDVLADQVTSLNSYRETQTLLVKKQEERERALQSAMGSMEKELSLRQQAMEMHKRKALESVQAVQDLKIRLEAFQQQQQEIQEAIADKTRSLEEEAFRAKRVQEECNSLKRKIEKQKKIDLYGAADEVLLEEVRQYKARLTCPCCNTRKKDAILTKCYHVFCFECLKTRYDTRQRKCPKCNATFGNNDFHKIYL